MKLSTYDRKVINDRIKIYSDRIREQMRLSKSLRDQIIIFESAERRDRLTNWLISKS